MRVTNLLAACVLPALVGCGTWRDRAPGDSRGAWRAVRDQHPAHKFTPEFESGFHDGYAECTTCGSGARPPAIPPAQFLRDRKYLSAAGHGLVRDYYAGFQYGSEVAAANGHALSVPAHYSPAPAIPYVPARGAPAAPEQQKVAHAKPSAPVVRNKFDDPLTPRAVASDQKAEPERAKLPKPEVPVIPPFNPDLSKFSTVFVPDADRLPAPVPALPVLPAVPERPLPAPAPEVQPLAVPVPSLKVPVSPSGVHTDVPPIPFKH